ncbi:MAG: oxygen-dependent coproporphyrinogen oxidase [bacterium]
MTQNPLDPALLPSRQKQAASWFLQLQDRLCAQLETLEVQWKQSTNDDRPAARFTKKEWKRGQDGDDHGGGRMAMMHGDVFEKAGIHYSQVYGEFSDEFRKNIPGAEEDPRFWAAGISFIAHPKNPHAPTAHMNTRMIVTTKSWFGGGGDLTPLLPAYRRQDHQDSQEFHAAMNAACAPNKTAQYQEFKEWCDRYFYLPHRDEPRGIGGIFYDRHNSGDWQQDFEFTQKVGTSFGDIYTRIVERRMHQPWTEQEREQQLVQRGRYAEFNLLYDRGTQFGLKTGGNVESILSSLPPHAKWP